MAQMDHIVAQMTEVFREVFGDDDIVVTRDLNAEKVDGWDSLAHVRLLLTLERRFEIRMSAMELAHLKTAGDLADLIETKLGRDISSRA